MCMRALVNADGIVVGPGSLYTSVLPNLLVEGVAATIYGVNAVRIYVANLMTEPGETDDYTLDDHLRVIRTHTGFDLFDYILVNRRPHRRRSRRPVCCARFEPVVAERILGSMLGTRRSSSAIWQSSGSGTKIQASSAFARARNSGVDQSRTINAAGLIPYGNVAGDRIAKCARLLSVARHSGWLVVQFVVGALAFAACGGSSSPPATPSPAPGDVVQISGRERFGWNQAADDITTYHFAVYVDNNRVELAAAVCRASGAGLFDCDSPLPPLTPGRHTLEAVSWILVNGQTIESPRAVALNVNVTGVSPSAGQVAGTSSSPMRPPSPSPGRRTGECGVTLLTPQEVAMWGDDGTIRTVDAHSGTAGTLAWKTDDPAWMLSGIAPHPKFAENHLMYLVEISASVGALRLSRYREIGGVLGERAVLLQLPLDSIPARTSVGFAPDGYLYVGLLASAGQDTPDSTRDVRFLVRVTDAGSPAPGDAAGSPFANIQGRRPIALAWAVDGGTPWLLTQLPDGGYAVSKLGEPPSVEHRLDSASTPVAMQIVDVKRPQDLYITGAQGDVRVLTRHEMGWTLREGFRLFDDVRAVRDAIVLTNGDVAACGSVGGTHYGIWRIATSLTGNPHQVLPRGLGGNQRAIGGRDQFIGRGVGVEHPDPDAHRNRQRIAGGVLFDLTSDSFGHVHGDLSGGAGHDDDELLAAETRTDVEDSHAAAQQVGDIAQRPVSFEMTPRIVDALEVIDVDHQQREVLLLPPSALHFGFEPILEVASVEEAGHCVDRRDSRQLRHVLGQAFSGEGQRGVGRKNPRRAKVSGVEFAPVVAIGEGHDRETRDRRRRSAEPCTSRCDTAADAHVRCPPTIDRGADARTRTPDR